MLSLSVEDPTVNCLRSQQKLRGLVLLGERCGEDILRDEKGEIVLPDPDQPYADPSYSAYSKHAMREAYEHIASLETKLAAIQKDAERLQWLIANKACVIEVQIERRGYRQTVPNPNFETWTEHQGWTVSTLSVHQPPFQTMREAIDFAMVNSSSESTSGESLSSDTTSKTKLTKDDRDLLKLIARSKADTNGWYAVSPKVFPILAGANPKLVELGDLRIRLTPVGRILMEWL